MPGSSTQTPTNPEKSFKMQVCIYLAQFLISPDIIIMSGVYFGCMLSKVETNLIF